MHFPDWLPRFLRNLTGISLRPGIQGVGSVERLRSVLEHERNRAERTGSAFAVIAFTPACAGDCRAAVETLCRVIIKRLRAIDGVGWLDERRIGAVLCGTSPEAARKVAEEICHTLPPDLPAPTWEIYSYPGYEEEYAGTASGKEPPSIQVPADESPPATVSYAGSLKRFYVRRMPLAKRCIDVVGAVVGLAIFAPIIAVAAIAVKLTSPGPVFFTQWRAGKGGQPFLIYKLRTMVVGAEARKKSLLPMSEQDGPAFKMKDDPRATTVGRILRKLSIDELPQLWNALKGDMSLVGPRPLPCSEMELAQGWQKARLDVTPGLTCIWQVEHRSRVSFEQWMRLDRRYIKQQSLLTDLTLIAKTFPAVLSGRGAQ